MIRTLSHKPTYHQMVHKSKSPHHHSHHQQIYNHHGDSYIHQHQEDLQEQQQQLSAIKELQLPFQISTQDKVRADDEGTKSNRQCCSTEGGNPPSCLRDTEHNSCQHRSKSISHRPSVKQKSIEIRRSHSVSTNCNNHRAFKVADLLFGEVLGQGFFGQAIKITHRVTGEHMVMKELHNFDKSSQTRFVAEVSLLRSLSHPCVLKFLGVLYRDNKFNLVTEFIDGGTLQDLLLDHNVDLSWTQRLGFSKDIAAGMSYLHSMGIIHRDLNSQNCLVRKDRTAVVADFGLAKIVPSRDLYNLLEKDNEGEEEAHCGAGERSKQKYSRQKRGTVVGNPYWMAPEMMKTGVYNEKVDVFSFGIIVCETIARITADPDYLPRDRQDFGLDVKAFRDQFCANTPEPVFMLAVICSQIEPGQRPNFEEIHVLTEALLLHVEYGTAVPVSLQGSTVDFHHQMKKKLYGKSYKDVNSCTDTASNNNTQSPEDCRNELSQTELRENIDTSQTCDSEHVIALVYEKEKTVSRSRSRMASSRQLSPKPMSDSSEKSRCDNALLHEPASKDLLVKFTESQDGEKTHMSDSHSSIDHSSSKININDDEDANIMTLGDDSAYFSSSSTSPSIASSLSCLSSEDASCQNSPHSSGNTTENLFKKITTTEYNNATAYYNGRIADDSAVTMFSMKKMPAYSTASCKVPTNSTFDSSVKLQKEINHQTVQLKVKENKWRWLGNTLRKQTINISTNVPGWNLIGKRGGVAKKTWRRTVEEETIGASFMELKNTVNSRRRWRVTVSAVICTHNKRKLL